MRLVHYAGKENGLMMIGSASELRQLGQALAAIPENAAEFSQEAWPPLVAEAHLDGDRGFVISFNQDTTARNIPKSNFPRRWPFG